MIQSMRKYSLLVKIYVESIVTQLLCFNSIYKQMKHFTLLVVSLAFSVIVTWCMHQAPLQVEEKEDDTFPVTDTGENLSWAQLPEVLPPVLPEIPQVPARVQEILDRLIVPEGFTIDLYAEVPNARSLSFAYDQARDTNVVFVGNKDQGTVYALLDRGADNMVDETIRVVTNRNMPNGVAYQNGDLYVAEVDTIHLFPDILEQLADERPIDSSIFYDALPSDKHHGWKYIAFWPEGDLYVPVGAPCNICEREFPYSSIMRINIETKQAILVAKGVRNTVGFAWDPETQQLRFTDNGRDNLWDGLPPDELNVITEEGEHFGYPYCYGEGVPDPAEGDRDCNEFTSPYVALGAHVAALGMKFYDGSMFPSNYQGKIFIAEHGSRNSTIPVGYRVSLVDPVSKSYQPFVRGWQAEGKTRGRPVDLLLLPDGSMLVSDDFAGIIYRISTSKT